MNTKIDPTKILFTLGFIFLVFSIILYIDIKDYETKIIEKFDRDYSKAKGTDYGNVNGQYMIDTQNIIIYTKGRYLWDIEQTWKHEFAHIIWYRDFNESQRKEWKLIFKNSVSMRFLNHTEKVKLLKNNSPIFVSNYAEKGVTEDFAESYSAWVLRTNKLDKYREEFMIKYVSELI